MNNENIIFVDTEFNGLNPNKVDLLSIGLIKPSGEELYLELEFEGELDSWVKENVVQYFNNKKVSKKEAVKKINEFVGKSKPYAIAYINQFDWIGILRLFDVNGAEEISNKIPFYWAPIDFSSILFEKGIKPGLSPTEIAEQLKIDFSDIKEHNALDDTKLLKRLYDKIILNK